MNKLTIIGNLTRAPETRVTQTGKNVCNFTVAVNRRKSPSGQQEADYFRVSAWDKLAEHCQKYLDKGKKVAVVGAVKVNTYNANDGSARAQMEVTADEVEFLSPAGEAAKPAYQPAVPDESDASLEGYEQVEDDDLPF